jgi:hypothetical protein
MVNGVRNVDETSLQAHRILQQLFPLWSDYDPDLGR